MYIYNRNVLNLDKKKFKKNLENLRLAVYCNDLNISVDIFLKTVNSILDRYVPLTRVAKRMEKNTKKHG